MKETQLVYFLLVLGEACDLVGARTLTVLKVGNSVGLWEFVSRVTTQNSLRGVGVESKSSFVINPWFKSRV